MPKIRFWPIVEIRDDDIVQIMRAIRNLRNALLTLTVIGLAAVTYLGNHYISERLTAPDADHIVPFAAHGDYVFITQSENRDYYLLWATTVVVGAVGGWASVVCDVRIGKIERPPLTTAVLVTGFFAFVALINVYWAFAN